MRLKDVEPYMKVECIVSGKTHINEGEVGEVISINKLDETIDLRGYLGHYHPSHFKPYNKYSVGEEVVDFEGTGKLVEIWAAHKKGVYAVKYENDEGNLEFDVRFEEELKPKKEKDKLEPGDKFKNAAKYKIEVLEKEYDKLNNEMIYFGKCENGLISVWSEYEVEEIVYD